MTGAELAVVDQSATIDVGRWAEALTFAVRMAEYVNQTEFVPVPLRGRPEAVAATIMYGAEIGVTPMQALSGIHIVEGRPAPSAELMRAMILRAGHSLSVHEATGVRVRVSGLRRGRPESERFTIEWTTDMARAAGLLGRKNWQNYPRAMLMARATGDLARILFPDVVKGLGYVAEETATADDVWATTPPEVAEAPTPKPVSRKGRGATSADPFRPPVAPAPPIEGVEDVELPEERTEEELRAAVAAAEADTPAPVSEAVQGEPVGAQALAYAEAIAEKPSAPAPTQTHPVTDMYDPEDVPLPPELQPRPDSAPALPVELEPEAPAPEAPPPGAGPPKIGPGPLKAVRTLLTRELGTAATDDERHQLLSAILGQPIEHSAELTRSQGMTVLGVFDRFADGTMGWEFTGDPALPIAVWDNRTPPPEDES